MLPNNSLLSYQLFAETFNRKPRHSTVTLCVHKMVKLNLCMLILNGSLVLQNAVLVAAYLSGCVSMRKALFCLESL